MSRFENVPCCDDCWRAREGDREAVRMRVDATATSLGYRPLEVCYFCDLTTISGIYVWVDTHESRRG